MVTRKLVVVLEGGNIPELNNVMGPITFPTRITIKAIAALVKADKKVFECDPKDPYNKDARIRLTKENFLGDNFGGKHIPVTPEPPKEPVPPSKPVEEKPEAVSPSSKIKEETGKPESTPVEEIIIPNSVKEPVPEKKEEVIPPTPQESNNQNTSGKNNKNNNDKGKK